ncbi:LxmA leader domain family RiPP [Streptomyces jumonjinensis]|uniref:LxmA leader domain family RiPP n=1 Tax=Streptomyces jumonjinensis TaxID=1945 RepID=UPI0037A62D92
MTTEDLMGGYTAYTSPNAAVQEASTTSAVAFTPITVTPFTEVTVSIVVSLITPHV